jgi:hypothetical protein
MEHRMSNAAEGAARSPERIAEFRYNAQTAVDDHDWRSLGHWMPEALDEIERLQAEVARLEAVVRGEAPRAGDG